MLILWQTRKSGGAGLKMTQKWECFVIISLQRVLLNLKNFRKGGACWNGTVLLLADKIYCVVEHTGNGYIVRHVYFDEKKAHEKKAFYQGMITSKVWEVKTFEVEK